MARSGWLYEVRRRLIRTRLADAVSDERRLRRDRASRLRRLVPFLRQLFATATEWLSDVASVVQLISKQPPEVASVLVCP